jgi:diguanylate cyclase (GGDEF)-like protein
MSMPEPGEYVARRGAEEPDGRVSLRGRFTGIGLALTLLVVSLFAVWSSEATGAAASGAQAANVLSDDYAQAASAVAGQESLERKYRLEPGSEVRASYDRTASAFVVALANVRRDGDAADRRLVTRLLAEHAIYLRAMDRMFAAVDRGEPATVLRIDREETEPSFATIAGEIGVAAEAKHDVSQAQLKHLRNLENTTRTLTPLVFLLGLLIAAGLAWVSRGHRRLLVAERARAVHNSLHDALSGLPNRTLLTDRLVHALDMDARDGTSTGLLLIDLDRFKEINDTFGHHYGDELLSQIGPRLSEGLRTVDLVARLGGDEFAVLLPEVASVDHAMTVATELQAVLEAPFHVYGLDLAVEASVGVVTSGVHGDDANTLLQRADIAMYVAKSQGTGVFAYVAAADQHSAFRLAMLGELRRALDRDELVLHFQPKIDVQTGDLIGAEALVRWQHPQRGLVFPDQFIPLAEQTGLIKALTRHVLCLALAQARAWSDAGRPTPVSVNLSARNLMDEHLPNVVADLLATYRVAPELLELEVTESALMTEPMRAQDVLKRLSLLGLRISIDDFGVGYTSLSQLKTLPVSELKIDRSFVTSMAQDSSNALIVQSVVDLGHNLGLSIVAEGVETAEVLDELSALGCDIAQGYLVGRPMPAVDLDIWRGTFSDTLAPADART